MAAAPNGSSIFPLTLPTQNIPAEFLQDAYVQLLELINAQCVAASGGTITGGAFNGTVGATTPSTGAFTALTATSGTINSDTIVTLGATQTLTNKTLSAVTISSIASTQTGTFTANGATAVVVANTAVTANSVISFALKTVGGTPAGAPFLSAVTAGTGFSVKVAAGDTSVYNYTITG